MYGLPLDVSNNDYFIQIISTNLRIFAFVEICNQTVRQNENILKNVHKLLNMNVLWKMKDRLTIFALQWQNRPIEFSAAGIFKLDRSFLLTVSFY